MLGINRQVNGYTFQDEHLISSEQFTPEFLNKIFETADNFSNLLRNGHYPDTLTNSPGFGLIFAEPSSRTFNSSLAGINNLNGRIMAIIQGTQTSSMSKGENIEDTIRTLCTFPRMGALIVRHSQDNIPFNLALIAQEYRVHIINAGDGCLHHPTQALLDLYTLRNRVSNPDATSIRIVFCNDIAHSRPVNSLCLALKTFYPEINNIGILAPKGIDLPEWVKNKLTNQGISITRYYDLYEAAQQAQVFYITRPQKERVPESKRAKFIKKFQAFKITEGFAQTLEYHGSFLMHPLPIDSDDFQEIDPKLKNHPNCLAFDFQVRYGVYVRMAIFHHLFYD